MNEIIIENDEVRKAIADEMGLPLHDIGCNGNVYINYECSDCDADNFCSPCGVYQKRLNQIDS